MSDRVVATRRELHQALGASYPGLVPTMGALHAGHLSLISRSAVENDQTVVSVFVNPTQFGDAEDLARYPRDIERDASLAIEAGADFVFAPEVDEIYPPGFATSVDVGELADRWEGRVRPGHFRAVATVVAILFNLVQPARAYFGEKDYQQLRVIQQLHRDLAMPGEIVACPTVRDADGLALSSRNARLSPAHQRLALHIPRAIAAVNQAVADGETDVSHLESTALRVLRHHSIEVDYAAIVDGTTLEPLSTLRDDSRLLLAASFGGTRLIDNAALNLPTLTQNDAQPPLPARRERGAGG